MEQAATFLGQGIQGSDQVLAQGLDGVRVHQVSSQMRARILLIKTCLHSPVPRELPAAVIVENAFLRCCMRTPEIRIRCGQLPATN